MNKWYFGKYLESLLEQKGGRLAGWHKKRLADETGLAYSYISYLLSGEASGRKDPPSPSIDVFINLSKVLNVDIMDLILAYQGKNPEAEAKKETGTKYKQAVKAFLSALPEDDLVELIKGRGGEILKAFGESSGPTKR